MTTRIASLKLSVPLACLLSLAGGGVAAANPFICCRSGPTMAEAVAQVPPVTAGLARVWFLRQFQPYQTNAVPMISANGAPVGLSQPGTAFYRDFAPGAYSFSVPSYGVDFGQTADLNLTASQQVFLEVQSLRGWASCGDSCERDTLYVRPISAGWAALYFPTLTYLDQARS